MSASSSKLACLRSRFGTPVDLSFLLQGFFVQSVHSGAVHFSLECVAATFFDIVMLSQKQPCKLVIINHTRDNYGKKG